MLFDNKYITVFPGSIIKGHGDSNHWGKGGWTILQASITCWYHSYNTGFVGRKMQGLWGHETLLTLRFQEVTEVRQCVSASDTLKGGSDIVSNFDGKTAVESTGYGQCKHDGISAKDRSMEGAELVSGRGYVWCRWQNQKGGNTHHLELRQILHKLQKLDIELQPFVLLVLV